MPLSHASGHGWARTFLTAGATVVIGKPDSEAIASRITEGAITATLLVPPVLEEVIATLIRDHPRSQVPTQLRFLLTGGRHVATSLVAKTFRVFGPVLHSYYGTTETGVNAIANPQDLMIDPRTSGYAVDGSSIRIINEEGEILPDGAVGRVVIGSYMNAGSYDTGQIPTVMIDSVDHILTADIGYIGSDADLRILGRGSHSIAATACGDIIGLEEDLRLLPGVGGAAVVADSIRDGLYVFLAASNLEEGDKHLLRYLAARLAALRGVRLPIATKVVPELRFSPTGKFDSIRTLAPIGA
jgi:acyl-coenzyme A synthetase/AMP-(fatty) acid ligase